MGGKRRPVIHVTQDDIDNGVRSDSAHCAVADAIKREISGCDQVLADLQTIRYSLPETGKRIVYLTPPAVSAYIVAFDAGQPLKPFSFALRTKVWEGDRRKTTRSATHGKAIVHVRKGEVGSQVTVPAPEPPAMAISRTKRVYGLRLLPINRVTDKP